MTYRELITLYKTGKLDEEQKKQIEADIERQEAISEYLFETEEIPGLEDLDIASVGQNVNDAMDEKFIKICHSSIRNGKSCKKKSRTDDPGSFVFFQSA